MKIVGIICEYNPFHNGHAKQLSAIRRLCGEDSAIVCLMSGNFVQRGHPAIIDKSLRAQAAVDCGADLVLEMPIAVSLSSAEGFASGSVKILSSFCDTLCFGAETASAESLWCTAWALKSESFSPALRCFLDAGLSFPAARAKALESMGLSAELLAKPNDTLAVEYCKAIISQGSAMEILPIHRNGDYHSETADRENPSATFLRSVLGRSGDISPFVPVKSAFQQNVTLHALEYGERAVLAKLRTMSDDEFEALPYGSEGLWRKLMHESRRQSTIDGILTAVKSKRYTRTRLDRMVMCAFLGLTAEDLASPAPYIRALAVSAKGRGVLKMAREKIAIYNPGQVPDNPYWATESRIGDLYGLFAKDGPEPPNAERARRIYHREDTDL